MDEVLSLGRKHLARMCTFPMCELGGDFQKYTTLMYTAGLSSWLDVLHERRCEHSSHEKIAGGIVTPRAMNMFAWLRHVRVERNAIFGGPDDLLVGNDGVAIGREARPRHHLPAMPRRER